MWTSEGAAPQSASSPSCPNVSSIGVSCSSSSSLTGGKDCAPPTLHELALSHRRLSDRARCLLDSINQSQHIEDSVVVEACKSALLFSFSLMENEALLLLGDLHGDIGTDTTSSYVTPWHASLAQSKAQSYLDTIQAALEHPSRRSMDDMLQIAVDSISGLLPFDGIDAVSNEKVGVSVSTWTLPNLSFDLTVGGPILHCTHPNLRSPALSRLASNVKAPVTSIHTANYTKGRSHPTSLNSNELPLTMEIRAIAEFFSKDIESKQGASVAGFGACTIEVESCVHRGRGRVGFGTGSVIGDAIVLVKLSPIGSFASFDCCSDDGSSSSKSSDDPWDRMNVKEARMVQLNAIPPKGYANVDLYTSSVHGKDEITVGLRFQTRRSLHEDPPHLQIDLVVR